MAVGWPSGLRQQFAKLRASKKRHTGSNPVPTAISAGLNRGGLKKGRGRIAVYSTALEMRRPAKDTWVRIPPPPPSLPPSPGGRKNGRGAGGGEGGELGVA